MWRWKSSRLPAFSPTFCKHNPPLFKLKAFSRLKGCVIFKVQETVIVRNLPVRQGIFLPESAFSADSLTCVPIPAFAMACIHICAHVKDPVVHVRFRWIMETLKHPECTECWVARLCRSWLSPGKKQPEFPVGEIPLGQYSCKK